LELSVSQKAIESYKYLLQFKDLALQNRENMLKNFIDENKNLKETIKSLQKTNIPLIVSEKSISFSPQLPKSKTITFQTESGTNNPATQNSFYKLPTVEFIKEFCKKSTFK